MLRRWASTPIDLGKHDRLGEMIAEVVGAPEVDSAIDAVGFEAPRHSGVEHPAIVLNQMMEITARPDRSAFRPLCHRGPGRRRQAAKQGSLSIRLGLGWAKAQSFHTGQTPVIRYNRQLMMAILHGRLNIAEIVNAKVISLEEAPKGYETFDQGAAAKIRSRSARHAGQGRVDWGRAAGLTKNGPRRGGKSAAAK